MSSVKLFEDDVHTELFSYTALSREDEVKVRGRVGRIKERATDALQAWCDIGGELKCLKDELPHGSFLSLVRDELGWGKTQVNEFILIHDHWSTKVRSSVHFDGVASKQVALELARKNTPDAVHEKVSALLLDGEKVTAADIRRFKAEAKANKDKILALEESNAALVSGQGKSALTLVSNVEADLRARIADLEAALSKQSTETTVMHESERAVTMVDAGNIVRPEFGQPANEYDAEYIFDDHDSEKNARVFSHAIWTTIGLRFSAKAFWDQQGRDGPQAQDIYQALLSANATIGLLIREFSDEVISFQNN